MLVFVLFSQMSKSALASFLILTAFISKTSAALGKCPKITGLSDVQPDGILGRWYEFARPRSLQQILDDCSYYDYSLQAEGFLNTVYTYYRLRHYHAVTWLTSIANSDMPTSEVARDPILLATDYGNYTVFYQCKEKFLGISHTVKAYILTRERRPSDEVVKKAFSCLKEIDQQDSVSEVNQRNCPSLV